ncbi:helix-hairpin-helix domain-containing protein [Metabacillus litoralis]|uniref:helix-hairpin-helix domain-containing protein n=1 Tax=Metabacillus litoralis TaxID=152268 RepID=UPI001CFC4A0C|nr:helix-hairpin-helix domain-containing protein [Metabacillus litoralis]
MNFIQKNKRWLIMMISLFILIVFCYSYFSRNSSDIEVIQEESENDIFLEQNDNQKNVGDEVTGQTTTIIVVDIKGAITKPGVYNMEEDARAHQLIEKAGGLNGDADELAINLAAPLQDGMVLYIPRKGETEENPFLATESGQQNDATTKKININTAEIDELQMLNGVGPAKAEAIISYREENGLFQKPEDLLEVTGIGEKSFEKIKENIVVK